MNKIKFPEIKYGTYLSQKFRADNSISFVEYDFKSMILVAINRYCLQQIICEICNLPFNFIQEYFYSFSAFEINSLATKSEEEIIRAKELIVDYDFVLLPYNTQYRGKIKIDVDLIDNGTFESSFYKIKIELLPEGNMTLVPYFMKDSCLKMYLAEYMQKIWLPVWKKLEEFSYSGSVKDNRYELKELVTIFENGYIESCGFSTSSRELVSDVFNIVYSILVSQEVIDLKSEISADDILSVRGLVKNLNHRGYRGGYKNHERIKIHNALNVLNAIGLLVVREVEKFIYLVSVPYQLRLQKRYAFPKKLVEYNYKTQLWNRRLGFCLCSNDIGRIKVRRLFMQVEDLCASFRPAQIRDKFEEVMDNLVDDGVIKAWHYEKIDEIVVQGKNWLEKWKKLYVIYRY